MKQNLIYLLLILLPVTGCKTEKETISVIAPEGSKVIEFAVSELSEILSDHFTIVRSSVPDKKRWNIVLRADSSMKPFSFSVIQPKKESNKTIYLTGYDETCVLHSVYTMLEETGYTFDITGIRRPEKPSLENLKGISEIINPLVCRRGIRQHINFLMDISSYPVEEAREYIKNLARLRMNYISFHSYPGQWISYNYRGRQTLAGNFFYGEKGFVPVEEHLKKVIRNDSIFCIPAIEPYWHDLTKRSQMAIDWLNTVMAEAKGVGMTVNMSYELREPGFEYAVATSKAILDEYPLIDGLELISEEDIENYIDQIKNNINCSEEIRRHFNGRSIQLSNGIYNTTASELKEGYDILRKNVSKDDAITVLPAHGARMAVKNLSQIPLTSEDLRRTMIYSWIEFDGLMYLQQNPVEGIRMLLEQNLKISGNEPLYGICWNHWRTYENRLAARYASEVMISGPKPAKDFYYSVARRSGIADADGYASAMAKLDETDTFCRDSLFNIGFCPNGYWLAKKGLSLYGRYSRNNLVSAIDRFGDVINDLEGSISKTGNVTALKDLQFIENRINCSILHLKAFVTMKEIQPLFRENPDPELSEEDRQKVIQTCNRALELEKEYVNTHSGLIPDRGAEGTLVSYMGGPYQCLKSILNRYGMSVNDTIKIQKPFDAPPEPGQ